MGAGVDGGARSQGVTQRKGDAGEVFGWTRVLEESRNSAAENIVAVIHKTGLVLKVSSSIGEPLPTSRPGKLYDASRSAGSLVRSLKMFSRRQATHARKTDTIDLRTIVTKIGHDSHRCTRLEKGPLRSTSGPKKTL